MAKYVVVDDGPNEEAKARFDRARWKNDGVGKLAPGFTLRTRGREGSLYYKEEDHVLELGLELAGDTVGGITVSRAGFRHWIIPHGEEISVERQRELEELTDNWFKRSGVSARFISPEADLVRDW